MTDAEIQKAVEVLQSGGVVAHATETCYGLACDMTNLNAVQKLFTIKHRPEDMPVSALFASTEQAKKYLEWNDRAEELATRHLPGPLTLILKQKSDTLIPNPNPNPNPSIGLRISSHPTALALVQAFGSPISTTSANVHGELNPYSVTEIAPGVDLVLNERTLPEAPASTVVDVSSGEARVLRKGHISI